MIKKILLGGLMAISSLTAWADEGMWVLHHIDPRTQRNMQQMGLKLSAQELYDPESGTSLKDAVVDFGDFCSGVVVSPDGLVFTNHHCGFSAIQTLSTTDDDILKNGFVARSHAEERPVEGLSVFFLQRTEDITDRVKEKLAQLEAERAESQEAVEDNEAIVAQSNLVNTSRVMDMIEQEYINANPGREVRVQSYCGGSQFFVSIYKEYRDIRLVFTPTQSLGKFGGDTDNWMWPRQTSDFSVFRVYADKDGEPAAYSKDNVPLHPKRWAQVSLDGYAPGDYCMTIGFPGSTSRYLSSYGITERIEQQNKPRIEVRGVKQDVWKKWMKSDRAIAIKYASKFASSSNYWKNSIGMNKALADLGVVAEKEKLEQSIASWVDADEARQQRFGKMLAILKEGYASCAPQIRNLMYMNETLSGMEIWSLARLADQLTLCEDSASTADGIKAYEDFMKDYEPRVDEECTATLLKLMAEKVDAEYLPEFYKTIQSEFGGDYAAYVHHIFSNTKIVGPHAIRDIILAGKDLQDDPALKMASEFSMAYSALAMQYRSTALLLNYNENLLTQAFLEMEQSQPHYSDANFSMRLSYGIVQDYTANGQHYNYFTNAQSLLDKAAKQDEIEDYMLEDNLINLLKEGDFGRYADKQTGELQLCFLSNNDITGGNSGSPMFNGKGELIGLAFDGNWEAMSGDISFDPALQRCIGVDIRFVLYLIDKWGHADNLISELRLK